MSLDTIFLLAMGPTWYQCPKKCPDNCEIWGINIMYQNHKDITKLFMMHDIRIEAIMHDPDFIETVNASGIPIYTPVQYDTLKNNIVYPIEEVVEEFSLAFFLNCMSYMLAYAIMQKPKKIALYGVDMRKDSGIEWHQLEKGCVEFWIGVGVGRGIEFDIPPEAALLKRETAGNWYGYKRRAEDTGLFYSIPLEIRRQYTRFKLIPIDELGAEIVDGTSTIRSGWIKGAVAFAKDGFLNIE